MVNIYFDWDMLKVPLFRYWRFSAQPTFLSRQWCGWTSPSSVCSWGGRKFLPIIKDTNSLRQWPVDFTRQWSFGRYLVIINCRFRILHILQFSKQLACFFLPMVRPAICYHCKKSITKDKMSKFTKRIFPIINMNFHQIELKQFSDSAWKFPIKFIQIFVDTSAIFLSRLHLILFLWCCNSSGEEVNGAIWLVRHTRNSCI